MIKTSKIFPKKLQYGGTMEVGFPASCNAIKVEVIADDNSWIVEY